MKMRTAGALALLMVAGAAHSKVVVHGTRVVYPAQDREVVLRMSNLDEAKPSVMQVWLDAGDSASTPDKVEVPFVVTPPVFRIEGGGRQALRLSYTGETLPQDRESLFWINVLEVPPILKDQEGQEGALEFSYRTRLKTFFRPRGLEQADSFKAPGLLVWSALPKGSSATALKIENPTPFHVSLAKVEVVVDGRRVEVKRATNVEGNMVRPFSSIELQLAVASTLGAGAEVQFTSVGDFGSRDPHVAPLKMADVGP